MADKTLTDPFVSTDPFKLFGEWLALAEANEGVNPNAMCLSTQNVDNSISTRMVLLKGYGPDGFVFYSNLDSRKAAGLRHNEHAALCFYWRTIGRQVTIEGRAQLIEDADADAYFASRDRDSQIGAWASRQSAPLSSRAELEERVREIAKRFEGQTVPRPSNWSGYRLVPTRIEFWHARDGRLHDRLAFFNDAAGWRSERLYP